MEPPSQSIPLPPRSSSPPVITDKLPSADDLLRPSARRVNPPATVPCTAFAKQAVPSKTGFTDLRSVGEDSELQLAAAEQELFKACLRRDAWLSDKGEALGCLGGIASFVS